ncbi:DUF6491 family protein [Caulobacter sp. 1776]|uniref:DUF6491 family protein n=1 Tax=Caulobacter sp. 1776 TaxID=3156420 RepID=UPI0033946434
MRFLIGSAALCALLVAGPAPAAGAPKPERSCFRTEDVNGFTVIDDQTVDVTITPKNVYRLTLFAPSPDIDWSLRIGIDSRGRSWVCEGYDAEIVVPGDIVGLRRYPVTAVRKLTAEEIGASRKKKG